VASDQEAQVMAQRVGVSIHARVWRATGIANAFAEQWGCFNPRPRVASDALKSSYSNRDLLFQSTPACGERREWSE